MKVAISVHDYPELIAELRAEVSTVLMESADKADRDGIPEAARRLREVAYQVECGLRLEDA